MINSSHIAQTLAHERERDLHLIAEQERFAKVAVEHCDAAVREDSRAECDEPRGPALGLRRLALRDR